MRQKRWQKTAMRWSCYLGLGTNVPVTDWHKPDEKHFHKIQEIEAIALPNRKGLIRIRILRVAIEPTTEKETLRIQMYDRLRNHEEKIFNYVGIHNGFNTIEMQNGIYKIEFFLTNGDRFCDTAIKIVREIFNSLGVKDEKEYRLSDFTVVQETYMRHGSIWITFANWLKIKNGLTTNDLFP